MGNIIILDENTSNKIAAGEVVERPASVVKELVENSLDAGASVITVEIRNGGVSYIKVMDNGTGMEEDDVVIAFERHSTSKIRHADDLENISTIGFRGEALASIAAVSSVQLTTRTGKNPHGTSIEIQGGNVINVKPSGCPVGTTIIIRDLFFNTPARFKFLKKDTAEAGMVSDIISRIALGNPQVSFKLTSNGSVLLHTPGNGDQKSTIFSVYGKDTAKDVYEVKADERIKLTGFVGKPEIARASRNHQTIFINRRFVRSKIITSALDEAYSTFLMKNKYAFAVLNLEINPAIVDINVHPSKMEVKFSNEQEVFKAVYHAVHNALLSQTQIRSASPAESIKNPYRMETSFVKPEYRQQSIDYSKSGTFEEDILVKETEKKIELKGDDNSFEFEKQIVVTQGSEEPVLVEEKQENRSGLLTDAKIVGQVFNTYIILQQDEELLLMDQHAAHERVVYEDLKERIEKSVPIAQTLMSTFVLELTPQELKYLEEEAGTFARLGFEYEPFGSNAVILRTAPYADDLNPREVFLELLDFFMSSGRTDKKNASDEAIYRIACKTAVKGNKRLDELEIKKLLQRLAVLENPYTCPHGRPSAIKISRYGLEKMFKRIV